MRTPDLTRVVDNVAAAFGLGSHLGATVAEPVREAWSNDVLRVRTTSGAYAVKFFPRGLGPEQRAALRNGMEVERIVLGTGQVPMPEPEADPDTGSWLLELAEPGTGAARLVRVHAWVDGTPCSDVVPSVDLVRDVGRSLGRVHALRLPGGDTSGLRGVDLERWQRAIEWARSAAAPWAAELAACTPLVEEMAGRVDQVRAARLPMRRSHRDLDPKNAVVRPDGRVALTDWDYAGPVLPGVELVVAASSFAGVEPAVAEQERLVAEFVAAYRLAGGDAEAPDAWAMAAEFDLDWLLRNVEGSLRPQPGDDIELRRRLAPELIGSLAADVTALERWARLIAAILSG